MTDQLTQKPAAPLRRMSLRSRIAWLSAMAVAIAITLTTLAMYLIVRQDLYQQFDNDFLRRTYAAATVVSENNGDMSGWGQFPSALAGSAYVGFLSSNNVLTASVGGVAPPSSNVELAVAQGQADHSMRTTTVDGHEVRVAAVPVANGALIIAQPRSRWPGGLQPQC